MKKLCGLTLLFVLTTGCTSTPRSAPHPSATGSTTATPTRSGQPTLIAAPSFAYFTEERQLVTVRKGNSESFAAPTANSIQQPVVASPDGGWIAALDGKHLRVALSAKPSAYETIASTSGKEMIVSFLWGDASKHLVYLVDPDIHSESAMLSLYVVDRYGSGRALIRRFRNPRNVVLERFSEHRGRVLWFETGEGGYFLNLSSVSVSTGSVRVLASNLEPLLRNGFAISPDLTTLYYVSQQPEGRPIKSRNLQTGMTRSLYTAPEGGSIDRLLVSPTGGTLLFAEGTNQSDSIETTWTIKSSGGRATRILDDPNHPNAVPRSWSPGGRYVWMDFNCIGCGHEGEYYLLDIWSRTPTLAYFKSEDDSVTFVGWLA